MSGSVIRDGLTGGTFGGGCASIVGNGNGAYFEWFTSLDSYATRSQFVIGADGAEPRAYITRTLDGVNFTLRALATATPPEEHDLPLAEGWSATEISSFSKDQFGRVHVAIHAIAETAAAGDRIISTLPVGFHAKAVQRYACVFMDGASGFAFASPYGAIGVYAYSPTRDVCLQLDFEAV